MLAAARLTPTSTLVYSSLPGYAPDDRLPAVKIGGRGSAVVEGFKTLDVRKPTKKPARSFDEVDAAVAGLVAAAPCLSDTQREQLAAILGGGR